MRLSATLGHTAAGTTMLAALLTPFLLYGLFSNGFVALGLHVDEIYSGGAKVRSIHHDAYTIECSRARLSPLAAERETLHSIGLGAGERPAAARV